MNRRSAPAHGSVQVPADRSSRSMVSGVKVDEARDTRLQRSGTSPIGLRSAR
jgi:hypothetical protein